MRRLFLSIIIYFLGLIQIQNSWGVELCKEGYTPCFSANEAEKDFFTFGKLRCIKIPNEKVKLQFPFDCKTKIICSQRNSGLYRSHSRDDTIFSLDLQSIEEGSLANIYSVEEGIAYIYDKCNVNKLQSELDNCFDGFGNTVKILHKDNIVSLYAHLSKILVKNGEYIKKGQLIGIEGSTGNAGHHHLHFGVYKPSDLESFLTGQSHLAMNIPFEFIVHYSDDRYNKTVSSTDINCSAEYLNYTDIYMQGVWE